MHDPSRRHLQVRVVIEDNAGSVEERRFATVGDDPLLNEIRGRCDAGLDPQEGPFETRVALRAEELAVQIDADLEARIGGHHLNRGRAAERIACDPDVLAR
jgi:hypothetical protein